jgi:hypothetical protein
MKIFRGRFLVNLFDKPWEVKGARRGMKKAPCPRRMLPSPYEDGGFGLSELVFPLQG